MSHSSSNNPKQDFSGLSSFSRDEVVDQLSFSDSIDDLLASGELQIDDLPIDEPLISDESRAIFEAYAIEMNERIARGEMKLIVADDF
ncbi:hypothetical protein ACQ4M3_37900 [Leptolyngbya sp. AN03gr2]|uniref:hypothetical protein n=1 Tax=unclassified Leptolyngbya TaxID=2650499 RepID=UPI003D31ADC4